MHFKSAYTELIIVLKAVIKISQSARYKLTFLIVVALCVQNNDKQNSCKNLLVVHISISQGWI